jgi:hypothetical protein
MGLSTSIAAPSQRLVKETPIEPPVKPDWRKIELENPGLSIRSAAVLGEGWNSRAYLVNNDLVFRFPKRSE